MSVKDVLARCPPFGLTSAGACRGEEGSAHPWPPDDMSWAFLRNVVPQLASLHLVNASRRTLHGLASEDLHMLGVDSLDCCPDHQLRDIPPSIAAQLTLLRINARSSAQGPNAAPLPLSNFKCLVQLSATVEQV
jgi:hypothetical protein